MNRELKRAKKKYYTRYYSENIKNIKKTWEGLKSIINNKAPKKATISQIMVGNRVILNKKEIVENYFVNVEYRKKHPMLF